MRDQSVAEYKDFIDAMAKLVRQPSYVAQRVRQGEKIYPIPSADEAKYNLLAKNLSSEQRALVADLIQGERQGIIGDLLAFLTWKKYRLVKGRVWLAVEPFGAESDYDLLCRLAGDTWPEEKTANDEET